MSRLVPYFFSVGREMEMMAIDLRATQGGVDSRGSARARVLNMGGKQKNIKASQAENGDFSAAI